MLPQPKLEDLSENDPDLPDPPTVITQVKMIRNVTIAASQDIFHRVVPRQMKHVLHVEEKVIFNASASTVAGKNKSILVNQGNQAPPRSTVTTSVRSSVQDKGKRPAQSQ